MENVHPSGLVPTPRPSVGAEPEAPEEGPEEPASEDGGYPAAEPAGAPVPEEPATAPAPSAPVTPAEKVVGVRHGAEVLRALGVLPEGCEIEYDLPPRR